MWTNPNTHDRNHRNADSPGSRSSRVRRVVAQHDEPWYAGHRELWRPSGTVVFRQQHAMEIADTASVRPVPLCPGQQGRQRVDRVPQATSRPLVCRDTDASSIDCPSRCDGRPFGRTAAAGHLRSKRIARPSLSSSTGSTFSLDPS